MDEYIYVRWELRENRYMALDWSYEPIRGYEKEKITESLIKTLLEVNRDNMKYLGEFQKEEQLEKTIEELIRREELNTPPSIEWDGPGFYTLWGDDIVTSALTAADVEYDLLLENGSWLSYITGWSVDMIYTTYDLKMCLMDIYACDIDTPCEGMVEDYILGYFNESDLDDDNPGIITNDINNLYLGVYNKKVRQILDEAEKIGRIDPAYLP